jgi:hypothetical protein
MAKRKGGKPCQRPTCGLCQVEHSPGQPHDPASPAYRVGFHAAHGRHPTWTDAMAHCDYDVRLRWKKDLVAAMRECGEEIPEDLR